jgi:hypothetical protein
VVLKERLDELRSRLKETLEDAGTRALAKVAPPAPLAQPGPEPPVVARLMVEIRSDGSHTIARGALEEMTTGEKVAVEARGDSPAQLASQLARALVATPFLARAAMKAMLEGKKNGSGGH